MVDRDGAASGSIVGDIALWLPTGVAAGAAPGTARPPGDR